MFSIIEKTFNSVNKNIQFTLDIPENNVLNFLDLSISIKNKQVKYKWYSKPNHSGICLRKDSWLPQHVKSSFVNNRYKYVQDRCSHQKEKNKAVERMAQRMIKNGFEQQIPKIKDTCINTVEKQTNVNLSLDFISDSCMRKMNKLKRKYDLPARITSRPGRKMHITINNGVKNKNKCTCDICNRIGPMNTCNDKYIVYEFSCKFCDMKYIGESCRPFKHRYREHANSIKNQNKTSALSEHHLKMHVDKVMNINDFNVRILTKHHSVIATRMAESRSIASNMPKLMNRRHEVI